MRSDGGWNLIGLTGIFGVVPLASPYRMPGREPVPQKYLYCRSLTYISTYLTREERRVYHALPLQCDLIGSCTIGKICCIFKNGFHSH